MINNSEIRYMFTDETLLKDKFVSKDWLNNLYIIVKGKGLSTNCAELKNEITRITEDGLPLNKVYVHLKDCEYMDSTFIGTLVQARNYTVDEYNGEFIVIKPTKSAWTIICDMGISSLVTREDSDIKFPDEEVMLQSQTGTDDADDILAAHQALADINEENNKKFSLLIELLKKMKE